MLTANLVSQELNKKTAQPSVLELINEISTLLTKHADDVQFLDNLSICNAKQIYM